MSRQFVLIPGAWHGAWSWQPVARRLREAGHRALCLTLPGLDGDGERSSFRLQGAVDCIVDELVRRELTKVTLVAHSWGGYPATAAAHRLPDRISAIVYFSALIPVPGTSLVADNPPENGRLMQSMIDSSPDYSISLPPELVAQALLHDAPEHTQSLVADLLVPQPGHYFTDPIELPSTVPSMPAAYLLAEDDRMLPRPGAEFAARLGLEPVVVPGGHDALLTRPSELAAALLKASEVA